MSSVSIVPDALAAFDRACNLPVAVIDEAARTELIRELEVSIRSYEKSTQGPPFPLVQLVLVAVTVLKSASPSQIYDWIRQHFPYHQSNEVVDSGGHYAITDSLHMYELPVQAFEKVGRVLDASDYHNSQWALTSTTEARCILQSFIANTVPGEARQPFRFLDLSAEIRNQIYRMVLCLPLSGVFIDLRVSGEAQAQVFSRDLNFQRTDNQWIATLRDRFPPPQLYCFPLERQLALLSVSRQVSKESMPIFYGANTFFGLINHEMLHMLNRTSDERFHSMRSLAFAAVDRRTGRCAAENATNEALSTFETMQDMHALRHLTLWTEDLHWQQESAIWDSSGVDTLASLSQLETLKLYGECPSFAARLKIKLEMSGANTEFTYIPCPEKFRY